VKIQSGTGFFGYPSLVREKKEGDGGGGGQSYQQQRSQSNSQQKNPESQQNVQTDLDESQTPQRVNQALEAFKSDHQTQQNGLNANLEGTGPGLKVILTDKSGNVIRRLSGQEFLKLRESVSPIERTSGKILDRKL